MSVSLENVSYTYPGETKPVIFNFSAHIEKGEFVSLIGKSGTGKSTLLKLIAGLFPCEEGIISVNGKTPSPGSVGYMPQRDLLLPWRTVMDNIMLPLEVQNKRNLTKADAEEWLKRIGLIRWKDALPKQLSGGMRQRVAFLRTLFMGSEVLLLDEPFAALDALTKREMHDWLLSIWKELDNTILFITHDLEEAILLSDKILLLHADHKVEEIIVDLPRPRSVDMVYWPEVQTYRKTIEKKIANE
ncbi:ABC transporter ATP-binding protein [Bacillus smithii]|uniref:ABC transporter ATP-binding protein n=1 Tax=Bacillus smithii TaxID=1479 RepID=UPI0030C9E523